MTIGDVFFWFVPVLLNLLILLWCRLGCEIDTSTLHKFPSKGHIVIFTLLSFVPMLGIIEFCVWLVLYITFRLEGSVQLKRNKFNKYWFEVDEE